MRVEFAARVKLKAYVRSLVDGKSRKLPEYRHWINMKSRCLNPNVPNFKHYGGRGVTVCERWKADFGAFFADMGPRPSKHHTIDRIENSGNYEPGNCRWATQSEQGRNRRGNRLVTIDGKTMTLAEAVGRSPVPYNTVLYRLKRGWNIKDAISRPAQQGRRPE